MHVIYTIVRTLFPIHVVDWSSRCAHVAVGNEIGSMFPRLPKDVGCIALNTLLFSVWHITRESCAGVKSEAPFD